MSNSLEGPSSSPEEKADNISPQDRYNALKQKLRMLCAPHDLPIEPRAGYSFILQRFMINGVDCQVLLAGVGSQHKPRGGKQIYARFQVPNFEKSDIPRFLIFLIEGVDELYIVPTHTIISSNMRQIHIPIPPVSDLVGKRNRATLNFEDYKGVAGVKLIKNAELDI